MRSYNLKSVEPQIGHTSSLSLIVKEQDLQNENTFEFRPVGYGCQDWKKIIAASEKAGAGWVVVEQDDPSMGKTPLECAEMSIGYLKTL